MFIGTRPKLRYPSQWWQSRYYQDLERGQPSALLVTVLVYCQTTPNANMWCLHRDMPVVLPEHLLPWLWERGHLPTADDVSEYWNHMAQLPDVPWVTKVIETGCSYVPLWLWGDDSQYNERNEKLVAVVCGSWLANEKNSKNCVYPLFTYRMEPRLSTVLVL